MRERTFQSKTEALLNQKYWIPDIRDKIQKVIRNCVPCIVIRDENHKCGGSVKQSKETVNNCFRDLYNFRSRRRIYVK